MHPRLAVTRRPLVRPTHRPRTAAAGGALAGALVLAVLPGALPACQGDPIPPARPVVTASPAGAASAPPDEGDDAPAGASAAPGSPQRAASAAPGASDAPAAPPRASSAAPTPPTASAAPPAPGALPVEFPSGALAAAPGDFVLAPPQPWLEEALAGGQDSQAFVFYGAWLTEAGPVSSRLRTLSGLTETLPNALVLPVRRGQAPKAGEVVLTAFASGSGMQRAWVLTGGPRPVVRYLDLAWDNPTGWAQKDDTLPEHTHHALEKAGDVGTTAACREGARRTRQVVVGRAGGRVLGLGFGGMLRAFAEADCAFLPPTAKLKRGAKVWVPVQGTFTAAEVSDEGAAPGRVAVKLAGEAKAPALMVSVVDIATALD